LGELAKIYAVSRVAFIGGSMVPLGGHNPLEAVVQGKPACWGPHFFNFGEIEQDLLEAGCGEKVLSEADLSGFLKRVLTDDSESARMGQAAERFSGFQKGIAGRIASVLIHEVAL
jgi:3-deoxy-D-manno-octulosonic-acid transferase